MNQEDINIVVKLLSSAIKSRDWDKVIEAQEYLTEYQEDPDFDEE